MNLLVIVIEHFNTIMTSKDGKHGLAYSFWLNKIFAYFNIECGKGKTGFVKQIFNITTLEKNECIPRKRNRKSKIFVCELIDVQKNLQDEVDTLTAMVAQKNNELVALKVVSDKIEGKRTSSSGNLKE